MAFVDDERDDPAADGDLDADVYESEYGDDVQRSKGEDAAVMSALGRGFLLVLLWLLPNFPQTGCRACLV